MKLEVGMYARTKDGYICRIININDYREPNMKYGVEASYLRDIMFIGDNDIAKASYEIIDLIEVGDYVNGLPITKISEYFSTHEKYIELYGTCSDWENEDIKSIVTKEQFESIKYRIGVDK